jgi:hypothetical protein
VKHAGLVPCTAEDSLPSPTIKQDAENKAPEQGEPQPEPFPSSSVIRETLADPAPILVANYKNEVAVEIVCGIKSHWSWKIVTIRWVRLSRNED